MHAVIRAYTGNAELADALVEHADEVRQVIGGIGGFKAYYVIKLAEGTSTVSVFENEEGAEESSRAAAAWLKENLPDLNVQAPYVTAGEVVLDLQLTDTTAEPLDDRPPICPRCGVTMVPAALSAADDRPGDWVCLECEELGEDSAL